jgi:hypothetical protein
VTNSKSENYGCLLSNFSSGSYFQFLTVLRMQRFIEFTQLSVTRAER